MVHGLKRKLIDSKSDSNKKSKSQVPPATRFSNEVGLQNSKGKWKNKERVLIFSSRGISYRNRHLMNDFRNLMPHSKSDTKMDRKDKLSTINEICEMKNCTKTLFFESKKKQDLYLWASNCPNGPSIKFYVENVHTMAELRLTGNCLKGSRPFLSFDENFKNEEHLMLVKELFTQIFSTPHCHPKSQPFVDHIFTFSFKDNRIWFRNYQILEENGELAEIGPRLVLNPIRIFSGSFCGATIYQNPNYISPNLIRRKNRNSKLMKYQEKVQFKKAADERRKTMGNTYSTDITDDVFQT